MVHVASFEATVLRWRGFVDDVLVYRNTPAEQKLRIAEHMRGLTLRTARSLMLAACFIGLLWWPLDFVLYANRPHVLRVFATWRAVTVLYCLGYYFTCDRWARVRRHYAMWGTLLGAGMTFFIATALGSLDSRGHSWFGALYLAPIMSFPFFIGFGARLAGATTVALAALAGFFGVHPANLAYAELGTAIAILLFSVAVAVGAGHATYHVSRQVYAWSTRSRAIWTRTAWATCVTPMSTATTWPIRWTIA
jgi:hypothetical protein